MSISTSLRKAAVIQERIETLRQELIELLSKAHAEVSADPDAEITPASRRGPGRRKGVRPTRRGKRAAAPAAEEAAPAKKTRGRRRAGGKRAASPSGPLAPAVVRVLQASKKPMNVRDILDGLTSGGFVYNAPEPKKNLAARIYRLKGVQQVGPGLFAPV